MAADKRHHVHLPEEIMIEILARLPVKSLLRFRCVGKNLCALITNPSFVTKHLSQTQATTLNNSSSDDPRIIIIQWRNMIPKYRISLLFINKMRAPNASMDLDLPCPFSSRVYSYIEIVGSCNGLVCIRLSGSESEIFLWNPATRQHRNLPQPLQPRGISSTNGDKRWYSVCLGFGFDSSCSNDFKLVRLMSRSVNLQVSSTTPNVQVYSKVTDSWREINTDLQFHFLESSPSAVMSGKLHWVSTRFFGNAPILCFDLGKELFQEMPLPDFSEYGTEHERDVKVVDDSLAVIVYYNVLGDANKCIDVWVMKEYGVENSWTKQFRVGPALEVTRLIMCFKNGEMILQNSESQLLLFDSNTEEFENLRVSRTLDIYDNHTYLESLVSVNGGGN